MTKERKGYSYEDYWEVVSALEDMVGHYLSLFEGDTHQIEDAYKLMKKLGYVDEDGFEL
jgi:hypothetical protein